MPLGLEDLLTTFGTSFLHRPSCHGDGIQGHRPALAMAGDTFTAEYVEFEVKRALEWLGADRNEGRRHAAVSVWGAVSCVGVLLM